MKYNAFCPWHFGYPFSLELPNVITWFFCYFSLSGIFFLQGGSDWKSDKLIIGGYGSWSWKSYNPIVVRKKEIPKGSRIIEEKEIMGWSIPIGLGEELESKTNKGRPWSSKSELKQPPSLTKDGGLQALLRCNFDPLEEIYDGLNMVEF